MAGSTPEKPDRFTPGSRHRSRTHEAPESAEERRGCRDADEQLLLGFRLMKRLLHSEELSDDTGAVHREVTALMKRLDVPGTLELTGASGTPGALTKGDIDLHLRVEAVDFVAVLARLDEVLSRINLDAWAATLAVFAVPAHRTTELAVTPIGSEHDRRFRLAWERLRSEPELLSEYNGLKLRAFGTPPYDSLKSDFFTSITVR